VGVDINGMIIGREIPKQMLVILTTTNPTWPDLKLKLPDPEHSPLK
jgi:hypothetical protein